MKKIKRNTQQKREVRHRRVRALVKGTEQRPRLSIFRSLKNLEVQLIDDEAGKTLCSAKTTELKEHVVEGRSAKVAEGYLVGKLIAEKAKAKGITVVVFDRGGYQYHGRVEAVAVGAREGGLEF
jgi:large subunit ribosomal protein L18